MCEKNREALTENSYNVTQQPIKKLLAEMEKGLIAPINMPYSWTDSQARAFIDHLYNGYKTGYVVLYQKPGGSLQKSAMIFDGQQRVLTLLSAIRGQTVYTDKYEKKQMRIAFNPQEANEKGRFSVSTSAHGKHKAWIPDISRLFVPGFVLAKFLNRYFKANPKADRKAVEDAVKKLLNLINYKLKIVTFFEQFDLDKTKEILNSINSKAGQLNEAAFVMFKLDSDDKHDGRLPRKTIDYFCHLAADASFYQVIAKDDAKFLNSKYGEALSWLQQENKFWYQPTIKSALAVISMLQLDQYSLNTLCNSVTTDEGFAIFEKGLSIFIEQDNFTQFNQSLHATGFIDPELFTNQIYADVAYALLLKNRDNLPSLRRWLIFTILTQRYERDPDEIIASDLQEAATTGLQALLQRNEEHALTDYFWQETLVKNLETTNNTNPYFCLWRNALILQNPQVLQDESGQSLVTSGSLRRIFSKKYLKENGIMEKSAQDQMANYAYIDINTEEQTPPEWIAAHSNNMAELKEILSANSMPEEILNMPGSQYHGFLNKRRKLMAEKIRDYYYSL